VCEVHNERQKQIFKLSFISRRIGLVVEVGKKQYVQLTATMSEKIMFCKRKKGVRGIKMGMLTRKKGSIVCF